MYYQQSKKTKIIIEETRKYRKKYGLSKNKQKLYFRIIKQEKNSE